MTGRILDSLRLAFGRGEKHLHAHHVVRVAEAPELRLTLENLKTKCSECHDRLTAEGK